ncbi:GNAT family N-acetyltransferase [uncultured Microscilla sp.]|uniref:GNAT family N-acetyltransferase n=1 Tax=uncultured Microscilla sp. TaxID=432653 RepID=UPI00260E5E70|nr:GNAT family N-acetyltransferase [uncultured Microscilla sp.]
MHIVYSDNKNICQAEVTNLYQLNEWSSASKPHELFQALLNSHSLVTARHKGVLVGIGNALSDGHLVVYYPHLLVHPDYQGQQVGKKIMEIMHHKYVHLHQQILVSDGATVDFYKKCGFEQAGDTQSMWIYQGGDH